MDDGRAFAQFAQVADDRFGFASAASAPMRLGGALGEQLALGEHRDLWRVEGEAVFEGGDGHGETKIAIPFGIVVPAQAGIQ